MSTQDHPLLIDSERFREMAHDLVDHIADHYRDLNNKLITPGQTPAQVRNALGRSGMPEDSADPADVMARAYDLMVNNSLLNSHPSFWGYIMGPGTQIGTLADMLAATVNPNCGGWELSPMAAEIEQQTIRWIAEWIGYPTDCGGILVSGGAMANYLGFLTAKTKQASWEIREKGLRAGPGELKVYCSSETHTWIQKAADLFGIGTDCISWIDTDRDLRMDTAKLEQRITADKAEGAIPFMVIATAGTVSTGVVDDLRAVGEIAQRHGLWYHVDGAYGAPAAGLESQKMLFAGIETADSIALDPHKWFYCPQEAGCVLVRDRQHLLDTFSYRPPYYHFADFEDEPGINFYEYGLQNSRGFRALKVWMTLKQAGKSGLGFLIQNDIDLARRLYENLATQDDFQVYQSNLSITTFRYIPPGDHTDDELNEINRSVMEAMQHGGRAFVTNAVVDGNYLMRACIVNYRSTTTDIDALADIIRDTYQQLQEA